MSGVDARYLGLTANQLAKIATDLKSENAKLWERIERLQPTDSDGNVLDIADTVHMLRSEYDGDHEWDDVIVELTLTKWGGDRWIVRGSKGEAWACDCTKTGYDEDAFEDSDDVEPFDDATLTEVENAKLRQQLSDVTESMGRVEGRCAKLRELGATMLKCIMANKRRALICWECPAHKEFDELRSFCCIKHDAAELGIEVPS